MSKVGRNLTIALIGVTGGLSVWQGNRLIWKHNLIKERTRIVEEAAVTVPPRALPAEIVKVHLKGRMQDSEFILVGPRSRIETLNGDFSGTVYSVFVPFLTDSGDFIWVNRGQMPSKDETKAAEYLAQWPSSVQEIEGIVREKAKFFKGQLHVHDDLTNMYAKVDIPIFWEHYKRRNEVADGVTLMPYMIDLVALPEGCPEGTVYPLPRHPEDFIKYQITPYTHMSYCATWTLSFLFGLHYLTTSKSI